MNISVIIIKNTYLYKGIDMEPNVQENKKYANDKLYIKIFNCIKNWYIKKQISLLIKKVFIWLLCGVILNFTPSIIEFVKNLLSSDSLFNFSTLSHGEMFLISICIVGCGLSEILSVSMENNFWKSTRTLFGIANCIFGIVASLMYSLYEYAHIGEANIFKYSQFICISTTIICGIIIIISHLGGSVKNE